MNLRKQAEEFLELGLNPVPVEKGTKVPLRKEHPTRIHKEEIQNFNWPEIGVSTGYASDNLEVLDWDLKNEEDPDKLLNDFMSLVGKELLQKLVVQSTPSGGFHFMYRCDHIESSQKLAKNEKGLAIIETRGIGGYIKCWPSEGYELEKRDFAQIPYITSEERFRLFVAARKLNRLIKEDSANRVPQEQRDYQSKFPDYDSDPQIGLKMLEDAGWTVHSEVGDWINFTRPGKEVSDGMSGGYNLDGNFFFAFSTSQDTFITERPYSNHQIYAELICGGDYKKAYAKLFDEGYGTEDDGHEEVHQFLSSEIEENDYLDQAIKGEIEYGLSTGWKALDEYMRVKKNSLNLGIGYEGIGKSVFMTSFMSANSLLHGWRWGLIAPENKNAVNRKRFVEALSGKPISYFKDDREQYEKILQFSRDRFKIIANKEHYSLKDIIEKGKKLYEYEGIDALLIDPFNFFAVDGDGYRHDNDILSKFRVFTENYCSVYIMAHPNSTSARTNMDKEGYLQPPSRYDVQGGSNFAYRVDDVFIYHRLVNHPNITVRSTMQVIVEKVKELDTGGKRHDKDTYSSLIWEERDGFTGYWDEFGNNPMYTSLTSKQGAKRSGLGDRNKIYKPF